MQQNRLGLVVRMVRYCDCLRADRFGDLCEEGIASHSRRRVQIESLSTRERRHIAGRDRRRQAPVVRETSHEASLGGRLLAADLVIQVCDVWGDIKIGTEAIEHMEQAK